MSTLHGTTDQPVIAGEWMSEHGELGASSPAVSFRPRAAEPWTPPRADPAPSPGEEPSRYTRRSLLGQGGMGEVWLARQESLRRDIALKIARGDLAGRQRDSFNAEAVCTAWLDHPNIIPVYDAGDGFIAMKRIEGASLETLLLRRALRMPETVDILIKICDAVSFAHSRGVIHRDIKPDNIMVGRFGEVMLMDWGLALQIAPPEDGIARAPAKGSRRSLCAGTPGYLAPEVARADADAIGPATDVFLLGAALYRILSGRLPFDGEDALAALLMSSANDWRPLAQLGISVHPRLAVLQERAMALDPAERPTVDGFQAVLRDWLRSSNAEVEAERCFERSRSLLSIAHAAGRDADQAYASFSEALHYLDRALALCPERMDFEECRVQALRDFAWSAACAGEPGLARLLRRSGRLPLVTDSPDKGDLAEENRRLSGSVEQLRGLTDALGGRLAEIQRALAARTRELGAWRISGLLIAVIGGVSFAVWLLTLR